MLFENPARAVGLRTLQLSGAPCTLLRILYSLNTTPATPPHSNLSPRLHEHCRFGGSSIDRRLPHRFHLTPLYGYLPGCHGEGDAWLCAPLSGSSPPAGLTLPPALGAALWTLSNLRRSTFGWCLRYTEGQAPHTTPANREPQGSRHHASRRKKGKR